jgi:hypothetical protein
MTQRRWLLVGVVVVACVSAGVFGARRFFAGRPGASVGDTTRAPAGQRIVVEILNASGVSGLARRATFVLRDRGFDVVGWGNDPKGRRTESVIIDYTNKPEAAERAARILGGAPIQRGKDSLDRGLDLTVKLGSSYRPPAEVFHP